MQQPTDIQGWGADAPLQNRPGVPAEMDPPRPLGNMRVGDADGEGAGGPAVKSTQNPLTPVYGTAIPPRGLSGVVRRLAYRIPDYKARRWALLLLADRIDVIEHNAMPKVVIGLALALAAGVRFGLAGRRRRRSWLAGLLGR